MYTQIKNHTYIKSNTTYDKSGNKYETADTFILQSAKHFCTSKISNVTFENDMDTSLSIYEYTLVFIRMK